MQAEKELFGGQQGTEWHTLFNTAFLSPENGETKQCN
jgi:hypothetical protein